MVDQGIPVTIASSYKGVLFNQIIHPLATSEDNVLFETPDPTLWFTLQETIYLHSPELHHTVSARVRQADFRAQRMQLTDFTFTDSPWQDRCNERVQPAAPLSVTVRTHHASFSGRLYDLSLRGLGLVAWQGNSPLPGLQVGMQADLRFQLSTSVDLKIQGQIAWLRKYGRNWLHLGMRLLPTPRQQRLLEIYIRQRTREIQQELQRASLHAREPRPTHELFF
jgi:hypothetical protein